MTEKVAFIGLGVMGYPMAGWLAKAGHDVTVFNRTGEKAAAWADEYGGRAVETVAEAAASADFVMTCVGDDPDVFEIVLGPGGVIESMASGRRDASCAPIAAPSECPNTATFVPSCSRAR